MTLLLLSDLASAQTNTSAPEIEAADIGNGFTLHYVEAGTGTPVIFVHGSLSDGGYWADQLGPFAQHYHALRTAGATTFRTSIPHGLDTRP